MNHLEILHREATWLAINKPPGQLVIPGRSGAVGDSLRERLEVQLGARVFVVHRLDKDTSGVLLFALEAPTHRFLSMAFEAGKIEKRYLALVEGRVTEAMECCATLVAGRKGRMRIAAGSEEGKKASTRFRPLETFREASLLEAEPLTGRTHQIRVHLVALGHPLLVDPQYGSRAQPAAACEELSRTPLHAWKLTVPAGPTTTSQTLEAPLPPDMAAALLRLRADVERTDGSP